VAFRDGPFENLKVPLMWTAALAVALGLAAAAVLLVADRRQETGGLAAARAGAESAIGPVNGVFAYPVRWIGSVSDWVGSYFFAVSENRRLRERVAELEAVRDANLALANVNARYEAMLGIRTQPRVPMATARSVSDARGPFARARLIDVGTAGGVKVGNPVINEHGLVGRVSGTSGGVSRVVLLTDASSQVPVLIDRSDARAILRGDGSDNPRLEYIRGQDALEVGDQVLSSGDGGGVPRGLPIGVVAKGVDGSWRVKLFSDRGAIDFVRVLKFEDFSQLVEPDALTAPPLAGLGVAPAPVAAAPAVPAAAPATAEPAR
jgi:rod shape-determining protein MreC